MNKQSILCIAIIVLLAIVSVRIIKSQVAAFPTISYSFVPVHRQVIPEQNTLDKEIKRLSQKYNQDERLVRKISECESELYEGATHKNINKKGEWWSTDFGPLMINDYWHKKEMEKVGLNIYDWQDSLEYGIRLLKNVGTKPWKASQSCWQLYKLAF